MRLPRAIKLEIDGQRDGCLLILTTNELLMTLMLIGGIHCLGMELFMMAEIILCVCLCFKLSSCDRGLLCVIVSL